MRAKVNQFIRSLALLGSAHVAFYWKYFLGELAFGSDIVLQNYPLRVLTQDFVQRQGSIPWWNPYAFSGIPLCGTFASLCFYPPSRATFFLPPWLAMNLLIVAHSLLGSIAAFAFFRELRYRATPALAGALAWSFGNFMAQRLSAGHLDALATIHWSPVIAYLWLRADRASDLRWVALAGVALAMQILAGYPQYVYLFHAAAIPALFLVSTHRRRHLQSMLLYLAVGLSLSAIQWVPALSILHQSVREGARDEAFYLAYASTWRDLLSWLIPYANGDGIRTPYRGSAYGWETTTYVGMATLFLAAQARFRHARAFALLSGAFVFLTLGANGGPLYAIFVKIVPLASMFRVPGRYGFSALIPLLVLFVDGLAHWLERPRPILAPLALGVGTAIALSLQTPFPGLLVVATLVFAGVLFLPSFLRAHPRIAPLVPALTVALLAIEWGFVNARHVRTTPLSRFNDISFAPREGRFFSIDEELRFQSQAIMHRKSHVAGYDPMLPKDYNRFLNESIGAPSTTNQSVYLPKAFPPMLSHASARWIVSDHPLFAASLPLFGKQGRTLVYQNPRALPRFHFVTDLVPADPDEVFSKMRSTTEGFLTTAFSNPGEIRRTFAGTGDVRRVEDRGDRIALDFDPVDFERLLVIRDNHAPGWSATTEKGPSRLIDVNGFMKAAFVPAGAGRLTLSFRPLGASVGMGLSALGGLGVVVLLGFYRRKPRAPSEREEVPDRA